MIHGVLGFTAVGTCIVYIVLKGAVPAFIPFTKRQYGFYFREDLMADLLDGIIKG